MLNEKGGAANRHILEDRGLAQYGENEDEEAIYSAVLCNIDLIFHICI